jgi:hypothetical protein
MMRTLWIALGLSLGLTNAAMAADKLDAWLNVFSSPNIEVRSLRIEGSTTTTGRNDVQFIEINVNGHSGRFIIQRPAGNAFGRDGVDQHARSVKTLKRYFRGLKTEVSNFQKIRGNKARGASIDFNNGNCRVAYAGIRGPHPRTYDFVVQGDICGDPATLDLLTSFMSQMKKSSRKENSADAAYHGSGS